MAFFALGAQSSGLPERLFKTSAKQRRRTEVRPGQCNSQVHIVTHTNNLCVHLTANREVVHFYSLLPPSATPIFTPVPFGHVCDVSKHGA